MKDIARLAGVSISTVSKVMNNKAGDISNATRKKVLDVIKKYDYFPYGVKYCSQRRTYILAVIIPSVSKYYFGYLLEVIEKEAALHGYTVSIHCSAFNKDQEQNLIRILEHKDCEGVLLITFSKENAKKYKKYKKPFVVIGAVFENFPSFYVDYSAIGEQAVLTLLTHEHKKIGCILEFYADDFIQGARFAMVQSGGTTDNLFCVKINDLHDIEKNITHLTALGVTAFFCGSMRIAAYIYKFVTTHHWEVSKDFSLIAFEDEQYPNIFSPELSTIGASFDKMTSDAVNGIVNLIENAVPLPHFNQCNTFIHKTKSIALPFASNKKRIVVIGSLNMDTTLSVSHLPQIGETIITRSKLSSPGGKGANQAIGVGKLNGYVSIIGRLGDDLKGHEIYRNLVDNGVNVEGIVFDQTNSTGSAYIMFDEDGNNTIAVFSGANAGFDPMQLESAKQIIINSTYALIQTEIPIETVKAAITLCKENNVKIILKPAPAIQLPTRFFEDIFLIIPNEMEARYMCPGGASIEEQAKFFLDNGIQNVIITLGEKGVFYSNKHKNLQYKAFSVNVVDTTGASDAFISALSVYLAEGNTMENSILFANYAASLSVTKEGVQTALPNRDLLRDFEKGLC